MKGMNLFSYFVYLFQYCSIFQMVKSFYSVNYYDHNNKNEILMQKSSSSLTFVEPPSAKHVADIYNRLSGLTPILREDKVDLTALHHFHTQQAEKPRILELFGGVLPPTVTKVIQSSAFDSTHDGNPSLVDIMDILKSRNKDSVLFDSFQSNDLASGQLNDWLKQQVQSVIILHHEVPSSSHYRRRSLLLQSQTKRRASSSSSLSTSTSSPSSVPTSEPAPTPLDEFQISQYQITLWTGLILVILLFASIFSIVNMEIVPDSLLYAKFQSGRTGKSD